MNTTRLTSALLLVFAALATCISVAWSEPAEPTVRIQPASIQVSAGATVQVTVDIHDVVNLGAYQFDLTYDPAIVHLDSITIGDFPGSTGRSVNPLGPRIEAGKAVYGAFSFGDVAGPDGSGTLAIVTLQTQAGGQTPIGLQNVQVIDSAGARIPVSTDGGTVTVSGSPPVPGQATATSGGESMRAATGTAKTALASPEPSASTEAAFSSPLTDWLMIGGALVVVAALVVLIGRSETVGLPKKRKNGKEDAVTQLRNLAKQARSLASSAGGHAPAELQAIARNLDEFAAALEQGTHSDHLIGQSMRNMYAATYEDNAWLVPVVFTGGVDRDAINAFFDEYKELMNALL